MTLSPTAKPDPAPASSTVPATSVPGMKRRLRLDLVEPLAQEQVRKGDARGLHLHSTPSPGSGSGASSTTRSASGPVSSCT